MRLWTMPCSTLFHYLFLFSFIFSQRPLEMPYSLPDPEGPEIWTSSSCPRRSVTLLKRLQDAEQPKKVLFRLKMDYLEVTYFVTLLNPWVKWQKRAFIKPMRTSSSTAQHIHGICHIGAGQPSSQRARWWSSTLCCSHLKLAISTWNGLNFAFARF
jgi:hypothetical protein